MDKIKVPAVYKVYIMHTIEDLEYSNLINAATITIKVKDEDHARGEVKFISKSDFNEIIPNQIHSTYLMDLDLSDCNNTMDELTVALTVTWSNSITYSTWYFEGVML